MAVVDGIKFAVKIACTKVPPLSPQMAGLLLYVYTEDMMEDFHSFQLERSETVCPTHPDFKFQKTFVHEYRLAERHHPVQFSLSAVAGDGRILEVAEGKCALVDLTLGFQIVWMTTPLGSAAKDVFRYSDKLCDESIALVIRSKKLIDYAPRVDDDDVIELRFSGANLKKRDFGGSSDPYFQLIDCELDTVLHESEVVKRTVNPTWTSFKLDMTTLKSAQERKRSAEVIMGRESKTIFLRYPVRDTLTYTSLYNMGPNNFRFVCHDFNKRTEHRLIGESLIDAEDILRSLRLGPGKEWQVIKNKKKAREKCYKNSGTIRLEMSKQVSAYVKYDHLAQRPQIRLALGTSLCQGSEHLITSGNYADAMVPLIDSFSAFTDDDLFYIRGFGASHPLLPSARSFSLNLANASEDSCTGSTEAEILYREFIGGVNIMRSVEVFDMVIADFAVRAARQHEATGDYVVLVVMVTADVIAQYDDSQKKSIRARIVEASEMPMSIVILLMDDSSSSTKIVQQALAPRAHEKKMARDYAHVVTVLTFSEFRDFPFQLPSTVMWQIQSHLIAYYESCLEHDQHTRR